jgi:hypothetical protein
MSSNSIEQEMGLVQIVNHDIRPGAGWADFTATFGRKEVDVKTLGSIAGNIAVRGLGGDDEALFRETVAIFGERARPPILSQQFMSTAYSTASIEQTLDRPKAESVA